MVCGRACFVSDQVGCGPDLIEENRTGATFTMGDVEAFARILTRYSNRQKLAHMGELARLKIEGQSIEAAATALTSAVRDTLTRSCDQRKPAPLRGTSHSNS